MIAEYRQHHNGDGYVVWIEGTTATLAAAKKMVIQFPSTREAVAYALETTADQALLIEGAEGIDLVADVPFVTTEEIDAKITHFPVIH